MTELVDRPPVMLARSPLELQYDVEQFLFAEVELLDTWKWRDWWNLFTDDASYRMPIRRNRLRRQRVTDELAPRMEMAHFDDNKTTLGMRVQQLESGTHWAEDPPSRSRHLITNIVVRPAESGLPGEHAVRSNFLCYRNRLETEVDIWAGQRHDVLRESGAGFQIASRTILLDQNVITSKNLSVFF